MASKKKLNPPEINGSNVDQVNAATIRSSTEFEKDTRKSITLRDENVEKRKFGTNLDESLRLIREEKPTAVEGDSILNTAIPEQKEAVVRKKVTQSEIIPHLEKVVGAQAKRMMEKIVDEKPRNEPTEIASSNISKEQSNPKKRKRGKKKKHNNSDKLEPKQDIQEWPLLNQQATPTPQSTISSNNSIVQEFLEVGESKLSKKLKSFVALGENDGEFKMIAQKFLNGFGEKRSKVYIFEICRNQNQFMLNIHLALKCMTINDISASSDHDKSMRELWHGSDEEAILSICERGFKRGRSILNLSRFGAGVYFAVNPSYCTQYGLCSLNKDKIMHMILAEVITGKSCVAKSDHKFLPNGCHSAVDNPDVPSIYMVYDDWAAYPAYVISFKYM